MGDRSDLVQKQMQKAMLSCTLNIARNFKIFEHCSNHFYKKGRDEHLDIFKSHIIILSGFFVGIF